MTSWNVPIEPASVVPPLILSPVAHLYVPEVQWMIAKLALLHGWGYLPLAGGEGTDRARCQLASAAMTTQHEWFFWTDADNWLPDEFVRRMWDEARVRKLEWLSAVVPCRSLDSAPNFFTEDENILLGAEGGLKEVTSAGIALAMVHRSVFQRVGETLPDANYRLSPQSSKFKGKPFFLPYIDDLGDHLGEDIAFCRRAKAAGTAIWIDTRCVAKHVGQIVLGLDSISEFQVRRLAREDAMAQASRVLI